MNLEKRVAYWVDAGLIPYQNLLRLQDNIVNLRKSNEVNRDIILAAQHPPEVNFGTREIHNKFSKEFLHKVKVEKGEECTMKDIEEVLSMAGISFSRSKRGGGATMLSPGQFVYYPIVNHRHITKKEYDLAGYKGMLDKIMFDVLKSFGIKNIEIASGFSEAGRERRDVWYAENGRSYKMGSKGINISKNLAYNGFVLYMDKKGLEHFWIVDPCGYDHQEVSVISAEQLLGRRLEPSVVNERVKLYVKKHFGYKDMADLKLDQLIAYLNNGEITYAES